MKTYKTYRLQTILRWAAACGYTHVARRPGEAPYSLGSPSGTRALAVYWADGDEVAAYAPRLDLHAGYPIVPVDRISGDLGQYRDAVCYLVIYPA